MKPFIQVFLAASLLLGAPAAIAQHHTSTTLELNEGKRWKVDAPMLANIRSMEKALAGYKPGSDHKALAATLQSQLNEMVSKCSMKGKAHDALHNWLMPFMKQVKALSATETRSDADALVSSLQASLKTFNQYFE